jgi:hypothetical protein
VDVRGGESQDLKSRGDQQVLTAVVFDKPVAMVDAVVLDHESRFRVVEVCTTNESALGVV